MDVPPPVATRSLPSTPCDHRARGNRGTARPRSRGWWVAAPPPPGLLLSLRMCPHCPWHCLKEYASLLAHLHGDGGDGKPESVERHCAPGPPCLPRPSPACPVGAEVSAPCSAVTSPSPSISTGLRWARAQARGARIAPGPGGGQRQARSPAGLQRWLMSLRAGRGPIPGVHQRPPGLVPKRTGVCVQGPSPSSPPGPGAG